MGVRGVLMSARIASWRPAGASPSFWKSKTGTSLRYPAHTTHDTCAHVAIRT